MVFQAQHGKPQLEKNKLQKRLRHEVGRAITDFNMIADNDRVMVCVSGGKDSLTMLNILLNLQAHAPIHFDLMAVNLDQKQPGFLVETLPQYFKSIGVAYHVIEEDTYSLVKELVLEGKTYCGWCSRFRRGILYRFAKEQGFNRIALGHHRDDMIETLFLNLFHGGKLKTMPPKLLSDDGKNVVIRPLSYCKENDIEHYAKLMAFPIIPCNLCGSQENLQRPMIKSMLQTWERQHPGRLENIFRAIMNVVPSHLADKDLYDFHSLEVEKHLAVSNL